MGWVLLGTFRDAAAPDVVRRLRGIDPPPRVVVLLDHVTREVLSSLLSLGVDALLVRSVGPEELADAVSRVDKGERVVAPVLLPLLVGVLGAAAGSGLAGAGAGGGSGAGGGTGAGNGWADGGTDADGVLTRKELEVLARLADGRSNKQIADALFVTQATVKTHLAHIYTKLNVTGRQAAVARAVELGLLR
ncbi:MAG: hypothetical protein QOK43_1876 [Acidimicrobiaceae bacterium]|nr:hypothetical protein [Acidimicrobiaceae bacterium]